MREAERWPDERLREYSREHLGYEIQMFMLARSTGLPANLVRVQRDAYVIQMALIEARANHARVLIDFLYSRRSRKDYVIAADFFDTPSDWVSIRPRESQSLKKIRGRTSAEVVHLTTNRRSGTPPDKAWDDRWFADLDRVLRIFADRASPQRLDPTVSKLITSGVPVKTMVSPTYPSSSVPGIWTSEPRSAQPYSGGTVEFRPSASNSP